MNWFKQQLANVAGTQEPEYGPTAIQSVAEQAKQTPYTEVTKKDLAWKTIDSTCVETQTFYLMSDEGKVFMVQVIYSNIMGVRITAQLNTKVFDHYGASKHQWFSEPLSDYGFDEPQYSFFADGIAFTLSEDGDSYELKSAVKEECVVNVVVRRSAPGFMAGKDGTSTFGTDPANPWGSMRHAFWPRCTVEGSIQTKEKTYDVKGKGIYIMALQGMKPHHLAERWNFINLQTPTYSAVMMEYTTPQAYGRTTVNVGGIAKDGELIYAGVTNSAKHVTSRQDTDVDWPEPRSVAFSWQGKTKDGQDVAAIIEGDLPEKAERIDVMGHIPGVIKSIVAGVAATRPYIYQYFGKDKLPLKIKIGDNETTESGTFFSEATFIS